MGKPDERAWFSQQVGICADALYGYAFRLTRHGENAEDLVAEAVTKAWSSLDSLSDRNKFRSWLFRILHNCYISDYRKRSVRPVELSFNDSQYDDGEDFADFLAQLSDDFLLWWGNPEKEFANKVLQRDIIAAIDSLPDVFRAVIVLITVEGLSYDEAAEVLDVPSGTVHSRMKRGRTLLQKALWKHATDAGININKQNKECAP